MRGEVVCRSTSPEETRAIAAAVATHLRPGDVMVLSGDLGAGKTCFAQGIAAARGVTTHVTSPSFVLVRSYQGDLRLVHADVYRLGSVQELIDLGTEELFDEDAVTMIEWGDAVAEELPAERLMVDLTGGEDARTIRIRASGDVWASRWDGITAGLREWTAL